MGELVNDNTLYTKLNSAVDHLNSITADLDAGKGTAGKLLKDETLYNNLNAAAANANQLTAQINSGQRLAGQAGQGSGICEEAGRYFDQPRRDRKGYQRGRGHGWRSW